MRILHIDALWNVRIQANSRLKTSKACRVIFCSETQYRKCDYKVQPSPQVFASEQFWSVHNLPINQEQSSASNTCLKGYRYLNDGTTVIARIETKDFERIQQITSAHDLKLSEIYVAGNKHFALESASSFAVKVYPRPNTQSYYKVSFVFLLSCINIMLMYLNLEAEQQLAEPKSAQPKLISANVHKYPEKNSSSQAWLSQLLTEIAQNEVEVYWMRINLDSVSLEFQSQNYIKLRDFLKKIEVLFPDSDLSQMPNARLKVTANIHS